MPRSRTRRGLLAAAGAALLAGCSGLDRGDEEATISSYHVRDDLDEDHEPVVVEAVPPSIERSVLTARAERTTALLGRVPLPLTAADVPNGYVRAQLLEAADAATDHLDAARSAGSQFAALQRLQRARAEARYAAAGWAYVEEETTASALRDEHASAVDDAESLLADHAYRGEDPVRAALVHATVVGDLTYVTDARAPDHHAEGSLLGVAEWGEHAERARATVADSRYRYERYLDSLSADAGSVAEPLAGAAEQVSSDLQARREQLPPTPTDAHERRFYRVRGRLRDSVEEGPRRIASEPGPANAVLAGTAALVDAMAYDRVVDRLDGDGVELETAGDVQTIRETALEALQTGLAESQRPGLVRPTLADAAQRVAYADEQLARYRGEVRPERLADPVGEYITATAQARSAPAACEQVLEALST